MDPTLAPAATSPFDGVPVAGWLEKTKELIDEHPLDRAELVEVVLTAWRSIFESKIGMNELRIGVDLYPKPQIMGFLLHEIVAAEFERRYPGVWRGDKVAVEKDLVYVPDDRFSTEVKTSSHKNQIFGNRSFAQKSSAKKKEKSGYYLAVNFGKFDGSGLQPEIRKVRFGWLDEADWVGQAASTGQQAHLTPEASAGKLVSLYP
jgi:hypothetical protein